MTKFKVIETKRKEKIEELVMPTTAQVKQTAGKVVQAAPSATWAGIKSLATIASAFGVKTQFISSIENIVNDISRTWTEWKRKRDALKKTNEEEMLLYFTKDKNGRQHLYNYIFGGTTPIFGIVKTISGRTAKVFLYKDTSPTPTDGTEIDGDIFLQNVNAISPLGGTAVAEFDEVAKKFSMQNTDVESQLLEIFKKFLIETTYQQIIKLIPKGAIKDLSTAGWGATEVTKYNKLLSDFMQRLI